MSTKPQVAANSTQFCVKRNLLSKESYSTSKIINPIRKTKTKHYMPVLLG